VPLPLPDDIPAPVRAFVAKAMAKNPADRYQSAADMVAAAQDLSTDLYPEFVASRFPGFAPAQALRPATASDYALPDGSAAVRGRPRPSARRRRLPVLAAVVVAAVAAALLGWATPFGIPGLGNPASPNPAPAVTGTRTPNSHTTNAKRVKASGGTSAAPSNTATGPSHTGPTSARASTSVAPPSSVATSATQPSAPGDSPTAAPVT
jgi:eukaryotic-like serine/threonine-protein kinase